MSSSVPVLFDAPGPKARARHAVIAVVGVLLAGLFLGWMIKGLANPDNNQLSADKWAPFLTPEAWTAYFLPGLFRTLQAALLAVVLSCLGGLLLGMGRLASARSLRAFCGVVVEFFRAVPVLMGMLFAFNFGLFVLQISGNTVALFGVVTGLTLYNSSVIAELIRSGVTALPRGQREAGLALGLSGGQTLRSVLLPQAVTAMLPSLVSQLVVILKDTALGYIITYPELIRAGQNFASVNGNLIPTLMVVAVMFILLNYALSRVARSLERRISARRIRAAPNALLLVEGLAPDGIVEGEAAVRDQH